MGKITTDDVKITLRYVDSDGVERIMDCKPMVVDSFQDRFPLRVRARIFISMGWRWWWFKLCRFFKG